MSNPARELHDQLAKWAVHSGPPNSVRGLEKEGNLDRHLIAAQNLVHVRNFLRQLDRFGRHTSSYWPAWESLSKALFVFPVTWSTTATEAKFSRSALATLDRLAEHMDDVGFATNDSLLQHLESLDSWLSEVLELLESDESLGEDRRQIIQDLVNALREAIAGKGSLDAESFAETLRALVSNLSSAANESSEASSRWRKLFTYGTAFSGNVAANIAAAGVIQGALQLTSG